MNDWLHINNYTSYEVIFPQISLSFATNLFRFASEGSDSLFLWTALNLAYKFYNSPRILGRSLCTVFALVIAPFFIQSTSVFMLPILSGQQRDLQLYVKSEPHRGLKFYHQKYNPLTPWWNERGSNPRLSGRERAPYPLSLPVRKNSESDPSEAKRNRLVANRNYIFWKYYFVSSLLANMKSFIRLFARINRKYGPF